MRNRRGFVIALASSLLIAVSFVTPVSADSIPDSGVASITLRVLKSGNGQQFAVTPRGENVLLPGAGVRGDDVHVFIGSNGGYWYVDKNGNQVDLHDAAAHVQAMRAAGGNADGGYPQPVLPPYNPNAYAGSTNGEPTNVTNVYNQQPTSSSSGGSGAGAVATGALAGTAGMLGGMAIGASMGYNNEVPYGHPVYYNGGKPYYAGANGSPVYVNNSKTYAPNMEQQNNWYNNQVKNNTAQYQNFQASRQNQFNQGNFQGQGQGQGQGAAAGAHSGRFGGGNAQGAAEASGGGRFGGGNAQGGGSGGRFGGGNAEGGGSGGRFGGGNAEGGGLGGRFGGANAQGGEGGGGLRDKLGGGEGGGGLRDKLGGGEGGRRGGGGRFRRGN